MSEKKKIVMSEKQMLVMREALEFYSRFLSGQFDAIPDEIRFRVKDREGFEKTLRDLKKVVFPELAYNESYSIGRGGERIHDLRQLAYEMYRQIYVYQVEERKRKGENVSYNVYDSPTMKYTDEALIEISGCE